MNKIIAFLIMLSLPTAAPAAEELLAQPRWSLELKGGVFAPSLKNWTSFYGGRTTPEFAGSLAYKFAKRVEFGVETGIITAKGQALAVTRGVPVGETVYNLYPVNVFVLTRLTTSEDQWLVPYAGAGLTRMYYRLSTRALEAEAVRGKADGFHVRGGLRFSLDAMDVRASNGMFNYYGVLNTWLFIEAEYIRAVVHSISTDLGGTAYRAGLLFEF